MTASPSRPELVAALAQLDPIGRKIVGGLVTVMIQSPERVKEREWLAEQLTQVVLLARQEELEALTDAGVGVSIVETLLRESGSQWMDAALRIFAATAEDLAPRVEEGLTRDQALVHALGFLMGDPLEGGSAGAP